MTFILLASRNTALTGYSMKDPVGKETSATSSAFEKIVRRWHG